MEKNWKIYVLKEPDGNIRYVGYTGGTLEKRLDGHIREAKKKNVFTYKNNWVRSLLNKNQAPIIELVEENISIDEIENREILYIKIAKIIGIDLTNATSGGDGVKNPSAETRKKMSLSHIGKKLPPEQVKKIVERNKELYALGIRKPSRSWLGKTRSQETNDKISISNTGKKRTAEQKLKMRMSQLGKKRTPEHIKNCAEAHIGLHHSDETKRKCSLSKLGDENPHFGKSTIHSSEALEKIRRAACKAIIRIDINTNQIEEFSSLMEASQKTGISHHIITTTCHGLCKRGHLFSGFIWKYKPKS